MTAVVGILNKRGVAIAADSAVTRTRQFNKKVTKNGNKMIRVSNSIPIAVMLTGNGDFCGTQWDIIVRRYRQQRGYMEHETVEDCVHDFFRYIADNHLFCDDELVHGRLNYEMNELFHHADAIIDNNKKKRDEEDNLLKTPKAYAKAFKSQLARWRRIWLKDGVCPQFMDYTQNQFHDYFGEAIDDFFEQKEEESHLRSFCTTYPKTVLDDIKGDFELTLMTLLTTRQYHVDGSAELVFSGFGAKQQYPSLVSASVYEGFDGRVNYHILPKDIVCISDEKPVAICPFAQTDVIDSILAGVHAKFKDNISFSQSHAFDSHMEIFNFFEPDGKFDDIDLTSLSNELNDIKVDDLQRQFNRAIQQAQDRSWKKWEKALNDYDLYAMAALAQSLIDLTGFHRILTFQQEGVGGLVDLAVITKNHGFNWLNRKSWYHHQDIGGRYGVLGV